MFYGCFSTGKKTHGHRECSISSLTGCLSCSSSQCLRTGVQAIAQQLQLVDVCRRGCRAKFNSLRTNAVLEAVSPSFLLLFFFFCVTNWGASIILQLTTRFIGPAELFDMSLIHLMKYLYDQRLRKPSTLHGLYASLLSAHALGLVAKKNCSLYTLRSLIVCTCVVVPTRGD